MSRKIGGCPVIAPNVFAITGRLQVAAANTFDCKAITDVTKWDVTICGRISEFLFQICEVLSIYEFLFNVNFCVYRWQRSAINSNRFITLTIIKNRLRVISNWTPFSCRLRADFTLWLTVSGHRSGNHHRSNHWKGDEWVCTKSQSFCHCFPSCERNINKDFPTYHQRSEWVSF